MKLNWKALAGILLAAVAVFIAVNVLYGDSYKLLSGDVINNQEEMTQLAEALLNGEESELYDKYDITYDIKAEGGTVRFCLPESEVGVYYVPANQPMSAEDRVITDSWYYFE